MLALLLPPLASSCSAAFEIGRPKQPAIVAPAGDTIIQAGDETVVEPPRPAAIETVITGLQQAQTVRMLTRQLAR